MVQRRGTAQYCLTEHTVARRWKTQQNVLVSKDKTSPQTGIAPAFTPGGSGVTLEQDFEMGLKSVTAHSSREV
jgi:hypothetical protein